MSENIYRRARLPLYYPLVFLLNILLIIALEVLLLYPTPLPLTGQTLAEQDTSFTGAVIVNQTESASLVWYLVQTDSGELQLVPARKHLIFQDRGRILSKQIEFIPADTAHMEVTTQAGIGGSTVMIGTDVEPWGDEQEQQFGADLKMRSKYSRYSTSRSGGYTIGGYFLLGVLLSLLESFLWNKIKGSI